MGDTNLPGEGASKEPTPPKPGHASDLKTWAGQMSKDPVAAKMKALVPGTSEGTAKVPFPIVGRETYLSKIKGSGIFKRAEDAPKVRVPLDKLTGIQQTVNTERLSKYVDDPKSVKSGTRAPGHGGLIDLPVVVKKDNKLFIHDGHHRLTAAKLRGEPDARVRFVNLDEEEEPKK